jgi:acyl-CoA thioesterase
LTGDVNPSALRLDTEFDDATHVDAAGDGGYTAVLSPEWSAPNGPNGGYLAAIVLRALADAVADPARAPRSLTLHYLRPPVPGPAQISVTVERVGRSLTSLSARMGQEGRACVLALAAFATEFPGAADYGEPMPEVPQPGEVPQRDPHPLAPPIAHRFVARPALGHPPLSEGPVALTGGWLRLHEPRPADALALALYADAWVPSPWSRLAQPNPAPTVDLTIHFRRRLPLPGADPQAFVLASFHSTTSAEGFFEEDALLWSAEGELLAQGRQLALLRPVA